MDPRIGASVRKQAIDQAWGLALLGASRGEDDLLDAYWASLTGMKMR